MQNAELKDAFAPVMLFEKKYNTYFNLVFIGCCEVLVGFCEGLIDNNNKKGDFIYGKIQF